MERKFVAEAALAAHAGDAERSFEVFREGLEFYANLCSAFFSAVPNCDRGIVQGCLKSICDTNRRRDPDSVKIEEFIREAFQAIVLAIPGEEGAQDDA